MADNRNPYDFLNAINTTKVDLMAEEDTNPNYYVPFITNRTLSYFIDTVMYANEMNLYPELDKEMQFAYYLKSIRPRKRFAKWVKPVQHDDLKLIQEVFGYNTRRAQETLQLLSSDDLEELRHTQNKGGKS